MKKVRCDFEAFGGAGACCDPAITAADAVEVLMTHAARMQDERYFWRWYATGPTAGQREYVTVVYVCGEDELVVVAAYPASPRSVQGYLRLRKEGALCIPAATPEST